MIENLYIKDFAILDDIDIEVKDGLTVITGETGSGKSILLQALNVSLGGKVSKTMVRSQAERAVVESNVNSQYYRRILNKSGRAKSFVNDEPYTENDFRDACFSLVDFHGQHEQQFIMNEKSHIDYLDSYCGLEAIVNKCSTIFYKIRQNEKKFVDLIEKKQLADQQVELLNFQLNEIQSVNPLQDEDIELENELSKLKHLDEIVDTTQKVTRNLTDDDESVYDRVSEALKGIERLENVDERLKEFSDMIRSASVSIHEASVGLNDYVNSLDHDQNRLVEVQDRLGAIDSLKRKYGGSIDSIVEKQQNIANELNNFTSIDQLIEQLKDIITEDKKKYNEIALDLHTQRTAGSHKLSTAIESEMQKLNMPEAKFEIKIFKKPANESMSEFEGQYAMATDKGINDVQFLLSANPGERLKPLVEIASGGEVSRIMLAIKTVFQKNDPVDTLVFDEIDSGISGNTADKVGQSLLSLAKSKQVICITHLPQIARLATNHLHIYKIMQDGQTSVKAGYLDEPGKLKVINQLTSSE